MGLMSESLEATYDGHRIEVEARVTNIVGTAQYRLVVDDRKADEIEGTHGHFTLRGQVGGDGAPAKDVVVRIHQRLTGTDYALEVDGAEQPLTAVS